MLRKSNAPVLMALVAAVAVLGTAGAADAKKKSKKKHRESAPTTKKANMPKGWAWPPSRAMKKIGDQCLADLDALGVPYKKGHKTKKIATPVEVPELVLGGVKFKPTWRQPPFTMDCHLALGLETYGKQLYALGVRTVKFSSIYRYDKVHVYGQERSSLSRHALGLAMDIHSFVDAAGNEAVVEDDYLQGNELLLQIEQFFNDSGGFRTVLTPRNDPMSHHDHFHVEIKVDYTTPVEREKPTS